MLFGIRNYFNKCMNGSRGYLNGSSLGISPTGTCGGEVLNFLKAVHVFLKQTFFFSSMKKENLWKVTTKISTNKGKKIYVCSVNRIGFMLNLFPLKF